MNFPRPAAEGPFRPALEIAERPHHRQIGDGVLGDRGLETIGLADHPARHVSAVTDSVHKELTLVRDTFFDEMIHTRQDVAHITTAEIAAVGVEELQSVTEATAKIRLEDRVTP